MSESGAKETDCKVGRKQSSDDGEKKKLKPCCACPETKRVRDVCVVENGEENCGKEIEAHKRCMRDMGFDI